MLSKDSQINRLFVELALVLVMMPMLIWCDAEPVLALALVLGAGAGAVRRSGSGFPGRLSEGWVCKL